MKLLRYYSLLVFAVSLTAEAAGPAPFGDIPANLSIGVGQSVRRNAAGTLFEAYTPGSGGGTFIGLDFTDSISVGYLVSDDNTALGFGAFPSNLTGTGNSAFGAVALGGATDGSNNTAVGVYAGQSLADGSNNTLIGWQASTEGQSTNGATVVGSNASIAGDNSVSVGYSSDAAGTNQIVLGALTSLVRTDPDNIAIIGNTSVTDVYFGANTPIGPSSGTAILHANGSALTNLPASVSGHDPTASVGLSAVNGSASTYLRSDGAPTLSQSIAPTWTAQHIWSLLDAVTSSAATPVILKHNSSGTPSTGFGSAILFQAQDSTTTNQDQARIRSYWKDATHATADSTLQFETRTAGGALTGNMSLSGAGGLEVGSSSGTAALGVINAITGFQVNALGDSRKILVGNGSNFISSTETYAVPGTSGNVMTSDGTNWTSAARSNATITLTGDTTGSGTTAITTTTGKVNGVTYPSGPSANTVPVVTSATGGGTVTYEQVPNAALANSAVANLSGTNTGDQTSVSGNAGTATALQNARTIGGVSFDGTGNIVPQTMQSVNEATDTTCFPLFISASGSQSLQPLNNTALTFNSNTGAFGATSFSGAGTGLTGTAASLTAGSVTTNANLTGVVTSSGNATSLGSFTSANLRTALTDENGTGVALFDSSTSATFITPLLGTPTSGDLRNCSAATDSVAGVMSAADHTTLTGLSVATATGVAPAFVGVGARCFGLKSGIDLKTNATTDIFTVPSSRTFICTEAIVQPTTVSGSTATTFTFKIQESGASGAMTTAVAAANIAAATTKFWSQNSIQNATGPYFNCAAGNKVQLVISTGAAGTTVTGSVFVFGYYIQ